MDIILIIIAGIATVSFLIVSILASIVARRHRQDAMAHCRYRPKKSLMVGTERRCFQLLNDIFGLWHNYPIKIKLIFFGCLFYFLL